MNINYGHLEFGLHSYAKKILNQSTIPSIEPKRFYKKFLADSNLNLINFNLSHLSLK